MQIKMVFVIILKQRRKVLNVKMPLVRIVTISVAHNAARVREKGTAAVQV
jgi:hypothetical protein